MTAFPISSGNIQQFQDLRLLTKFGPTLSFSYLAEMKVNFGDKGNSWKAIKVLRPVKTKTYRQTSIWEFFDSKNPENPYVEASEDEDSFIVEDESTISEEEETPVLGKNLFEESKEEELENNSFNLENDEIDFFHEDGTFDINKFNKWIEVPIWEDKSFKEDYSNFTKV